MICIVQRRKSAPPALLLELSHSAADRHAFYGCGSCRAATHTPFLSTADSSVNLISLLLLTGCLEALYCDLQRNLPSAASVIWSRDT